MSFTENIREDLNRALKEGNTEKATILRSLNAAIKNEEISKRPEPLTDDDVIKVVKREVKKLNDAIEEFKRGGREDLAGQYKREADILEKYLPEQASPEEIRKIVKEKISESEDKNFGSIMKAVMAGLEGRSDGGTVSKIVKEELEN